MLENIAANRANFCIGPQAGTFCTVDNEVDPVVMHVKNTTGVIQRTYTFYPAGILSKGPLNYAHDFPLISELYGEAYQASEFVTIQYIGPYEQASYFSGAIFYTLEKRALGMRAYYIYTDQSDPEATNLRVEYSSNIIRKWVLNNVDFRLELEQSYILNSNEDHWFGGNAFAIDNSVTSFADHTAAGTGVIEVTTTSGLKKYDILLLGPSSDTDNPGKVEQVYVHSITDTTVEIRTYSGAEPTQWEYVEGDPITLQNSIYLFADPAPTIDDTFMATGYSSDFGTLYKLDQTNYGAILDIDYKAFYAYVPCATWNNYFGFLSFIKGNNLLHLDTLDYEIAKSQDVHLENPSAESSIPVYDLDIKDDSFYKLQKGVLQHDITGDYYEVPWNTYNYHVDTFIPYSNSITLYASERILLPEGQAIITLILRDQFGVGLLGKNVWFTALGDIAGVLTPADGYMLTDANGRASIIYDAGSEYTGQEEITAKVDGGNSAHGSTYIVATIQLQQTIEFSGGSFLTSYTSIDAEVQFSLYFFEPAGVFLEGYPAFVYPGGTLSSYEHDRWEYQVSDKMLSPTLVVRKVPIFSRSDTSIIDIDNKKLLLCEDGSSDNTYLSTSVCNKEIIEVNKQLSVNYISRHVNYGNIDSVNLDQFVFINDTVPAMWSEKNNVDTEIWARLRPFAASLNEATLVFNVKEQSYAGTTDWVNVAALGSITLFDAGGGLLGIDFFYKPSSNFHHNAIVYVHIEVYDTATVPNLVILDYWFRIIQDYKAPYVINHYPEIEAYDVPVDTTITFDLVDDGEGVDIATMKLFVNHRQISFIYDEYEPGNYHIYCTLLNVFHYGETVIISLEVEDRSDNSNFLLDGWSFYCAESTGPWFDMDNTDPALCLQGRSRKQPVAVQVYGINDTGIDYDSIKVEVGGKYRVLKITPIVYRLQ